MEMQDMLNTARLYSKNGYPIVAFCTDDNGKLTDEGTIMAHVSFKNCYKAIHSILKSNIHFNSYKGWIGHSRWYIFINGEFKYRFYLLMHYGAYQYEETKWHLRTYKIGIQEFLKGECVKFCVLKDEKIIED